MKRLALGSLVAALALAVVVPQAPHAQMRVTPLDTQQGHTALGLALRHLGNVGVVMEATAHPDDEDNGLLVMLNRGQGFRTTLATATRGNGGQNEIGPEIFESLGVLRTEELAALHRFDGAEQYFTRAVDFGYSFSIDETFQKWGRDEITADYVRLIRMIRPDVIFGMSPAGNNGGQHHNASAVLSHEAYKLAADATKYPEQIKDGLRPWQAKKYYWTAAFGPPVPGSDEAAGKLCRINSSVYDSLLGRTYSEIGTEARSMHKCQGMAQLLALPGPVTRTYRLVETTIAGQMQKDEKSLSDGIDTSIASLAQFAGPRPSKELVDGLALIHTNVLAAQKRFDADNDDGAVVPLVAGLHSVRVLRAQLRAMAFDEAAKFEIEFRLRQKEREFQQAIIIANGLRIDALSDDGLVVPGQDVKLSLIVANNGEGEVGIRSAKFDGFAGDGACALAQVTAQQGFGGGRGGRGAANAPPPVLLSSLKKDIAGRCDVTMKIPPTTRASEPYWHRRGEDGRYTFDADAPFGLPFRPTTFYAQMTLGFPGAPGGPAVEEVFAALPVQYRYSGDIFSGEKRSELLVVPALSVRVSPEVAIVPASSLRQAPPPPAPAAAAGRGGRRGASPAAAAAPVPAANSNEAREMRVTVVNGSPGASESVVSLALPQGWTSVPVEQPLKLARPDESQTLRFMVKPPMGAKAGEYPVRALVKQDGATYDRGYQVIEYPHIHRQHIYEAATTTIKIIDVNTIPNLTIGYVMGVGDQVPPAIEQLGAKVELVSAEDLAWGNLSRFDAIVTGVRAYERRSDLRANNSRLLDYVNNGGTVIVQYNKFEFNDAQYGPYPAKVSNDRVTDEHAPIKVLNENSPLLNAPNRINDETWNGWVQERGLYFLGADHDSRYKDLLEISDGFEFNPGAKKGALVQAQYGKGQWVYVGLGLWRELPAGVDGAYQLLANLVSLGKTSKLQPPAK